MSTTNAALQPNIHEDPDPKHFFPITLPHVSFQLALPYGNVPLITTPNLSLALTTQALY
jgi:hypothetical protein